MAIMWYKSVLTGIGLTSKMGTVGWPTLVIKVLIRASIVHAVVLHAVSPLVNGMTMLTPSGQQESAVEMKSERELLPIMEHRAA